MQSVQTIRDIIRNRSRVRHKSLESRAQGKLAHAVREGADGKGPRNRDLAGGLLYFEDESF